MKRSSIAPPTASMARPARPRVSIVGCVGIPAAYGGLETLAANLADYRVRHEVPCDLDIYCSALAYHDRPREASGAKLRYLPIAANGPASILYDAVSIACAMFNGVDVVLVLGVSGAFTIPIARIASRARFIVNIDGVEWKRQKWSRTASWFLRVSEKIAAKWAHVIVADNRGIVEHVAAEYAKPALEIAYGGDHAGNAGSGRNNGATAHTAPYALMLCRIEPENNIHLILEAFSDAGLLLVAVGNWANSDYGKALRRRYEGHVGISILDPVFDRETLFTLRCGAALYVHGHSAGGTNPSLVEMMYLAKPVFAFDCVFNRYTTENQAEYFTNSVDLAAMVAAFDPQNGWSAGDAMKEIADRRYTWAVIGERYFRTMLDQAALVRH